MMKNRILIFAALSILILVTGWISPFVLKPASAHISKTFVNYIVEVGWNNEPAYTGLMNAAQVTVKNGNGDSAKPVINALKNMQISVKYGTVTKQLDFVPSSTEDGQYVAPILPTRVGSYSLVMKGSIEDQYIDTEISLDDVANIDVVNFPPISASDETSTNMEQIGIILNQLTNDIEEAKRNSDAASQSVLSAAKSFQDVKDSTDRFYMISMTGLGIGIAVVVIAVIAISRKNEK